MADSPHPQHHMTGVDPRLQAWLDRHLEASASRQQHEMRAGIPLRPLTAIQRSILSPNPDPVAHIKDQTIRLAPFDTVLEVGFYGPRRHIFERVGPTQTLQRTEIAGTNGWEITEEIVSAYTPTGFLECRTGFKASYAGGIAARESRTYDPPGHQTSCRREYFDAITGALSLVAFDSACYDDKGFIIMRQWAFWFGGEWKFGERQEYGSSDTSSSVTTYGKTDEGWMPNERSVVTWHPEAGGGDEFIDQWRGGRWVNYRHIASPSSPQSDGEVARSWIWEDRDWAPESRTIFSTDSSGTWSEWVTFRWEGGEWRPFERQRSGYDTGMQKRYEHIDCFDSVWTPERSSVSFYDEEGNQRQIDTSWGMGSIGQTNETITSATGLSVQQMNEEWADGAIRYRFCTAERFNPSGHVAEYRITTWEPSLQTDERYAFTYDAKERITAIRHYYQADTGWVLSCLPSPDATYGYSTSWDIEFQSPSCNSDWSFYGFTELTFLYRTKVTGTGLDSPTLPQTTTLLQNYPNPFNPATTIPFAVATGARTVVAIFDVLGREVARPVDEWKDPGEYQVAFDAKGLASGMYICRFTSGSVSQTRKMMVLR